MNVEYDSVSKGSLDFRHLHLLEIPKQGGLDHPLVDVFFAYEHAKSFSLATRHGQCSHLAKEIKPQGKE